MKKPAEDGDEMEDEPGARARLNPPPSACLHVAKTRPCAYVDTAPARMTKPSKPHGAISTELKAALNKAVAVGGFHDGQEEEVTKLAKRSGKCTSIEAPIPQDIAQFAKLSQDGCDGQALLVYFSSVKDAVSAVTKLHRQSIGSAKNKASLWARQVNGEGANVSSSSLCAVGINSSYHCTGPQRLCWR